MFSGIDVVWISHPWRDTRTTDQLDPIDYPIPGAEPVAEEIFPNPSDETLALQLAISLRTHPRAAANALKAIVEEARRRATVGDFSAIRRLADQADDAVENLKAETDFEEESLATLASLAQQVLAVLAIMGGSDGRRDSGYYRAPLAHAERLDAMTDGVLRLVDLVNLIGQSDEKQVGLD
jgi:hypothetical protein